MLIQHRVKIISLVTFVTMMLAVGAIYAADKYVISAPIPISEQCYTPYLPRIIIDEETRDVGVKIHCKKKGASGWAKASNADFVETFDLPQLIYHPIEYDEEPNDSYIKGEIYFSDTKRGYKLCAKIGVIKKRKTNGRVKTVRTEIQMWPDCAFQRMTLEQIKYSLLVYYSRNN